MPKLFPAAVTAVALMAASAGVSFTLMTATAALAQQGAPDPNAPFIFGAGGQACGTFLEAVQKKQEGAFGQWLAGYTSSLNVRRAGRGANTRDSLTTGMQAAVGFCQKNPTAPFVDAANAAYGVTPVKKK